MTTLELMCFLVGLLVGSIATVVGLVGLVAVVVVFGMRRAGGQMRSQAAQDFARGVAETSRAARTAAPGPGG